MEPSAGGATPGPARVVAADDLDLGPTGRVAFAYLLSRSGQAVPRDELADVLWGERLPSSWDASLRGLVARLRQALSAAGFGPDALVTEAGCYRLRLPDATVPAGAAAVATADSAAAALAAGDARGAAASANLAVDLAARGVLPGAEGAWVEQHRSGLREVQVRALETLAEAASVAGDPATAVRAAEAAIALAPFRESAHLRLMAAHDRAGSRGEALRAYERCRRLLADELGVRPSPATEAAYLALLGTEPPPPPPAGAPPPGNLPLELTTFVGRDHDLAEVGRLLASSRLVTLTGPGGVGKTRLALKAAEAAAGAHPAGTFLVELAPVADGALVAGHVRSALGAPEQPGADDVGAVASLVGDRAALVVLDNCEHVVHAAALVAEALLRACPGLRILATSREQLRVAGETVRVVPPLEVPAPGLPDPAAALAADAVRLFAERARSVDPGFDPSDDLDAVARVCRRLDGLPLALELAAARAGALSAAEIAGRLDDRFRLLSVGPRTVPARHRTLAAAVDWSYAGLAEPERRLFDRLSVFAGGFTLDAAEQVGAGDGVDVVDVLHLVWTLVSKSLVVAERRDGGTRYRLLETLRHYGREQLEASGRGPAVHARHLAWAVALADEAGRHLGGAGQEPWLARLDAEHDNLRAALEWAGTEAGGAGAVRLAGALGRFWELRGHLSEGRRWLAAARAPSARASAAERARALTAAAVLAQRQGDWAEAGSLYEAGLVLHGEAGDDLGTASALLGLGNVAAVEGDLTTAAERYERCLDIGAGVGSPAVTAAALTNLGWVEAARGDPDAARRRYEEALAAQEAAGDGAATALTLGHLGDLAGAQGDADVARALHGRSLDLRRRLGDRLGVADSLARLGDLALRSGDGATARSMLEESIALRRELGDGAGLPASLRGLADVAAAEGDHDAARALLEESLAVASRSGDRHCVVLALLRRARLARLDGDHEEAERLSREAVAGPDGSIARAPVAEWLEGLGASAGAGGRHGEAARLLAAAGALRAAIGVSPPAAERVAVERQAADARAALGEDAFRAEWARGERMGVDEAVRYAASRRPDRPAPGPAPAC